VVRKPSWSSDHGPRVSHQVKEVGVAEDRTIKGAKLGRIPGENDCPMDSSEVTRQLQRG